MVIESATGESYLDVLAELWQDIGAKDPAYSELGPKRIVQTSGGLFTSSRDLLRFGKMMLDNGKVNDTQVIPSDWIADTIQANDDVVMVKLSSQPEVQNTPMYLDSMVAMKLIAETLSK